MQHHLWQGRRVLLTGHTGFKGSWLALWLRRLGAQVVGYALPPVGDPNLYSLSGLDNDIDSRIADVRDLDTLSQVVEAERPEVIFHLAAQSLVRPSYETPVDTYAINVMGTVHLLEAMRRHPGVRAAVMVTSDKCYENREWVWPYRENEPMGGHDPYSNSKGCAELVTSAFRASYFSADQEGDNPAIATARAGNVIGGGDWAVDRLLPDIMRSVLAGDSVHIRSPAAIRPWQHVLEPLAGYLQLAEHLLEHGHGFAEGWNFGPEEGDARPVGWIVERMAEHFGPEMSWSLAPGPHPHEAHTLKLDSSKAKDRLGWRPRLRLETTLEWVVEWYRAHQRGDDLRALCLEHIQRYENLG